MNLSFTEEQEALRDCLRDTAVRVPWSEPGGTQSSARSDGTDADPRTEEEP